jgi:hypothetical protein
VKSYAVHMFLKNKEFIEYLKDYNFSNRILVLEVGWMIE